MPTAHIEAKKEDIAKKVLMPGDPLRCKYIADNFLTDVKIVNNVRNMTAYTGFYNGEKITVFPSGMGIPSVGIYSYELYNIYDVEEIIRIGTSGSNNKNLKLLDVVLADSAYTMSSFPKAFDGDNINYIESDKKLNQKIIETAKAKNINLNVGPIITSDIFDPYIDFTKYIKNYDSNIDYLALEMEAFGLFYIAKKFNKKAAALTTIVDIIGTHESISSSDRQNSLNDMIKLALDAITLS
ncbi:MAG: purine-nucleoside phosphorylase [bacterium]|nr:purine-nucleoside phosphorylase [bacterium]